MTPAARERAHVRVPLLTISAAAWILLVAMPEDVHRHHATSSPVRSAGVWLVMLVAMMAPLLTEPVRHIRDRSLARQRARSIALFVAAYAGVWMAAGWLLDAVSARAAVFGAPVTLLSSLCIAAVWQCSPLKQRCLNRGHVHPELAPGGRGADIGAARFGLAHGLWCVGSCWALMAVPLLVSDGHLMVMMAISLWLAAERLERPSPASWRVRAPLKAWRAGGAWILTPLNREAL